MVDSYLGIQGYGIYCLGQNIALGENDTFSVIDEPHSVNNPKGQGLIKQDFVWFLRDFEFQIMEAQLFKYNEFQTDMYPEINYSLKVPSYKLCHSRKIGVKNKVKVELCYISGKVVFRSKYFT